MGLFAALMGVVTQPSLPYTPLQYIETTGTQYIDTGVAPDFAGGDEIRLRFHHPAGTGAVVAWGCRGAGVRNGIYSIGEGGIIVADSSGFSRVGINIPSNQDSTVIINDSLIVVNSDSQLMPKRVTCAYPVYLFALNDAGVVAGIFSGVRFYEFSYYHNGVLAQHLVPALDANAVPCMWDTVSNRAYYNAGTGTFKVGFVPGQEIPIDGEYGVFISSGAAITTSAMSMTTASVKAGESINVYSAGRVDTLTWLNSADVYVHSGGYVGYIEKVSQAVNNKENFYVYDGGYVDSMHIISANSRSLRGVGSVGSLLLSSASVSAYQLNIGMLTQSTYGGLMIASGATVSNADISANHFRISSGGTALAATVYTGGNMSVFAGGTALNVVNSGGNIVNAGGVIEYA